jgi:hypothetical protein
MCFFLEKINDTARNCLNNGKRHGKEASPCFLNLLHMESLGDQVHSSNDEMII